MSLESEIENQPFAVRRVVLASRVDVTFHYVPPGLCSPRSMFSKLTTMIPQVYVPPGLSPPLLYHHLYFPKLSLSRPLCGGTL